MGKICGDCCYCCLLCLHVVSSPSSLVIRERASASVQTTTEGEQQFTVKCQLQLWLVQGGALACAGSDSK